MILVRVPATTANLGPGFDCLGLALDLWNEAEFSLQPGHSPAGAVQMFIEGEGAGRLPANARNLMARAALRLFSAAGRPAPGGLTIVCRNQVPLSSGMGSSAAAIVAGLAGANALAGSPFDARRLLELAAEMEHHADNAGAAALGGLVLAAMTPAGAVIARRVTIPALTVVVAVPEFNLPTQAARAALPQRVPHRDAAFNLARTALVVEALRCADLDLLGQVMEDRLHQPFRLAIIPGAVQALAAARQAGAAAAGISGAGPGMIAFGQGDLAPVAAAMENAFRAAGLPVRSWQLSTTPLGVQVIEKPE